MVASSSIRRSETNCSTSRGLTFVTYEV
jgi:hypothetical protein